MNLLSPLPRALAQEEITRLLNRSGLRIERIVSTGHASPEGFWYEQTEAEWVLLLHGWGEVEYGDGTVTRLQPGDWLDLPAGCRHRVRATSPDETTVWLAIFYPPE